MENVSSNFFYKLALLPSDTNDSDDLSNVKLKQK